MKSAENIIFVSESGGEENAVFLLNVPPMPNGAIHPKDQRSPMQIRAISTAITNGSAAVYHDRSQLLPKNHLRTRKPAKGYPIKEDVLATCG